MTINKHASRLAKLSWQKNPKTKEKLSEMGRMGWSDKRREEQRQRMLNINLNKKNYEPENLVT